MLLNPKKKKSLDIIFTTNPKPKKRKKKKKLLINEYCIGPCIWGYLDGSVHHIIYS